MRDGVIGALMKSAEPWIGWKPRVHVRGENPRSRAMRPLREEIRTSARVRALLSRRTQLGKAGTARQVYYKWQGLHWVLAALADLGYPAGDESLFPIRDRVVGFWTGPSYFHEFAAKTQAEAYRQRGVPIMEGRARRCASQQGNALRSVIALGIGDERTDVLVERLLHWQWPDGGWNCDRKPSARTSSFNETWLPMLGLAAYAREHKHPGAARAVERAAEVFLSRRMFKRKSAGGGKEPGLRGLQRPLHRAYKLSERV